LLLSAFETVKDIVIRFSKQFLATLSLANIASARIINTDKETSYDICNSSQHFLCLLTGKAANQY
jgi:hypothetical protein